LNFSIDTISDAYQTLYSAAQERKKEANVTFLTEIAFFIHFVKTNYQTKQLFEELLNYDNSLNSTEDYISTIKETTNLLRQTSQLISNHIDFKEFISGNDDGWSNPFGDTMSTSVSILVRKIENLQEFVPSQKIEFINNIYSVLVSICERWEYHVKTTDISEIRESLAKCLKLLRKLDYQTEFLKQFVGSSSAIRLNSVFRSTIPTHQPSSIERFMGNIEISGSDLMKDKQYLNDCKKIREYLIRKLEEGFSIEVNIKNFISYMECYRNATDFPKGEKQLQNEFELFLFNKGYFPLSEVQLKNARIDTLAVNDSNAFLIEYKQIGWSRNKTNLKTELEKINSSFIQSEIYSKRLNYFPSIRKIIYVIVFSKYYFIFKNGISELSYNGLIFKFFLVYLGIESPSKIQKPIVFDIETMTNK
jgi:hypothetical protein